MKEHICPSCNGKKGSECHHNTGLDSSKHYWTWADCSLCSGRGVIDDKILERLNLGKKLFEARRARGLSLFEVSASLLMSASNVSAIETGRKEHSEIPGFYDYVKYMLG